MASEFSSWTPYHYVHNNPIMLVDPTGMSADWFENELTGDVYYNSEMTEGDEGTGAMEGEGWNHLGENNMFSDGTPGTSDESLIANNSDLSTSQTIQAEGNGISTEAMFERKNAQMFMAEQGYSFEPSKTLVNEFQISYPSVETGPGSVSLTTGKKTTIGLTGTYAKNGTVPVVEKTNYLANDVKYSFWTGVKKTTDSYVNQLRYESKKGSGYYLINAIEFSERSQGNHTYQRESGHNLFPQYK